MKLNFWKLSVILSLFFICISTNAQVLKFRTTALSTNVTKENGGWKGWSEFEDSNLLVTVNLDVQRITIYADKTQNFDITDFDELKKDEDGDDVFTFYCVDNEGRNCRIKFYTLHSQNGGRQMYIYYDSLAFLFNIYLLD